MKSLYRRLNGAGLHSGYVKSVALPEWWSDDAADTQTGFEHALLALSRTLGVSLSSLRDEAGHVEFAEHAQWRFKERANASVQGAQVTAAICHRVAQLVALGVRDEPLSLPPDGATVRDEILGLGEPWVGLENLLEFCWRHGIAVIHVGNLPKGARKTDGMAAVIDGRPVIVITNANKHCAWLLFILAHELGHLIRGHVDESTIRVEESVSADANSDEEAKLEAEADSEAVAILTGEHGTEYRSSNWIKAERLADVATQTGVRDKVDPGHIILNYAKNRSGNFYGLANAALNILDPNADAPKVIADELYSHLDWSALPTDGAEFLARVIRQGNAVTA